MDPASRTARQNDGGGEPQVRWQEILDGAAQLAEDGRDLRLMVIVARALHNLNGLPGLTAGLDLLDAAIREHWDHLHPALRDRPNRREAALRRINAIHQLESAEDGVLCDLDFTVMFALRGLGPVSGGDLAAASLSAAAFRATLPSGLGAAEEAEHLGRHDSRVARVTTACRALAAEQPARLDELREAAGAAREALVRMEAALSDRVAENGVGVQLLALGGFLDRLGATLAAAAGQPKGDHPMPTALETARGVESGARDAQPRPPEAPGMPGAINSRRDVERALDLIIEFYERTEPASPIPLLARRMRKMVPMTFIQLMEEVAPSGMKEFRNIAGVSDEKAK